MDKIQPNQLIYTRWFKSWPFYPLVGGHLTFKGVTEPPQKGHKELPGRESSIIYQGFMHHPRWVKPLSPRFLPPIKQFVQVVQVSGVGMGGLLPERPGFLGGWWLLTYPCSLKLTYGWWFRNPVNSPVEVGSLSHYLQGFYASHVVQDFFHQQYPSKSHFWVDFPFPDWWDMWSFPAGYHHSEIRTSGVKFIPLIWLGQAVILVKPLFPRGRGLGRGYVEEPWDLNVIWCSRSDLHESRVFCWFCGSWCKRITIAETAQSFGPL